MIRSNVQVRRAPSRNELGSVLILVALALLLLIGFGALAVDGSHIYAVRSQCQATADSAALGAALQLPNLVNARAAALSYGTINMDPVKHGTVIKSGDVEFGTWNFTARTFTPTAVVASINAVRVTAHRTAANSNPLTMTLGNALGVQTADITAKAVSAYSSASPWDLVLLQDVTASFGAELAQAKTADHNLLDCFHLIAPPASLFGIVTFTGWGKIHSALTAIGTGYSTLNTSINNIKLCDSAGAPKCSGTDIAAGLEFAVNMLAGGSSGSTVPKAIMLVSDGQPEPDSQGSHPSMNQAQLKALATTWANNANAANISIFVVYYDADLNASAKAYMATLVRGTGVFLSTPDPAKIPDLLNSICGKLVKLHLVN